MNSIYNYRTPTDYSAFRRPENLLTSQRSYVNGGYAPPMTYPHPTMNSPLMRGPSLPSVTPVSTSTPTVAPVQPTMGFTRGASSIASSSKGAPGMPGVFKPVVPGLGPGPWKQGPANSGLPQVAAKAPTGTTPSMTNDPLGGFLQMLLAQMMPQRPMDNIGSFNRTTSPYMPALY